MYIAYNWVLVHSPVRNLFPLGRGVKLFVFIIYTDILILVLTAPTQSLEVPRPGIQRMPQQRPKLLQWQCWILNLLHCKGTPTTLLFLGVCGPEKERTFNCKRNNDYSMRLSNVNLNGSGICDLHNQCLLNQGGGPPKRNYSMSLMMTSPHNIKLCVDKKY